MSEQNDPINAFVPLGLLSWAANPDGSVRLNSTIESVVLFCDISGFTTMTNRLVAQGSEGLEALSHTINSTMDAWINAIGDHGGNVAMFIGDALVSVWPVQDPESYVQSIVLATAAGDRIKAARQQDPMTGESVQVKCGVGVGSLDIRVVTVNDDLQRLLVDGIALTGAVDACDEDQSGATPVQDRRSEPHWPLPPIEVTDPSRLARFVSPVIRRRLAAGQFEWLGELRRLSVVVVGLPEATDATSLQHAVSHVAADVPNINDNIFQVTVDDKGTTALIAFGAPVSHDDAAPRAVSTAIRINETLNKLGITHSIGVSSGRAFCGAIGNRRRRTYSAMGDVLNLASRLMSQRDGLLVDRATAEAAAAQFQMVESRQVTLKGLATQVEVGRPTRRSTDLLSAPSLVGRTEERALINELLETSNTTRTVIFEGEAGLGKSALAHHAISVAREAGWRFVAGAADAMGGREPYGAWRDALTSSFSPGAFRAAVDSVAVQLPELADRLPLLASLSAEIAPDQELTADLSGNIRASNIRSLFLEVFNVLTAGEPVLIILEDAHWFDSASWALVSSIGGLDTVRVLMNHRPIDHEPIELAGLRDRPTSRHFVLQELGADDVETLIKERLGVTHVHHAVTDRITRGGSANPLFAEQLVLGMIEAGHLVIDDSGTLDAAVGFADAIAVTNTVESLLTSRIDLAPAAAQLTLKVASVIGRDFAVDMLSEVHPLSTHADVPTETDDLADRRLIRLTTETPDRAYEFWHALTRDVAYEMIPTDNRRSLHSVVAAWYERDSDSVPPGVLAFHHRRAENWTRAAEYLDAAARDAASNHSSSETARYLEHLIEMADDGRLSASDDNIARWRRLRGEALVSLGEYDAARAEFTGALHLLGEPFPRTILGLLWGVTLRFPSMFRTAAPDAGYPHDTQAGEMAQALQMMTQIAYFNQNLPEMLYSSSKARSVAERSGHARSLSRAYGTWSIVSSVSRLSGMARRSNQRSLEEAQRDGSAETIGFANLLQAVANLANGEWELAEDGSRRAITAYDSIGAQADVDISYSVAGTVALMQGDSERSIDLYGKMSRNPSDQSELWRQAANTINGLFTQRQADPDAIQQLLRLGRGTRLEKGDAIYALGVAALASPTDRLTLSTAFGEMAGWLRGMPASNGFSGFGLFGIAATAHLVEESDDVGPRLAKKMARRAVLHLRMSAFQYPATRPLLLMATAARARTDRARHRRVHRALRVAERFGAGYAQRLNRYFQTIPQTSASNVEGDDR